MVAGGVKCLQVGSMVAVGVKDCRWWLVVAGGGMWWQVGGDSGDRWGYFVTGAASAGRW